MITLDVSIEHQVGPVIAQISGLQKQIPFATATAINNTLNDAQAAIRLGLPKDFILRRRDFVERTVYIGPKDRARKDNLVGVVRINPARDFLAKFEEGGQKKARAHALAVPILRETNKTLIIRRGDPLSVKKLFDAIAKRKGRVFKGRRKQGQAAAPDFGRVFLVQNSQGTFIIERLRASATGTWTASGGRQAAPVDRGATRVLYWFRKSVPIEDQLHFAATAMDAALIAWNKRAADAIEYAIATMR